MKKVLLVMLVLVLIAAAGLTEWASVEAQKAYADWVNELAARPEIALLDTHYQSGWWVSNASTELEIRGDLGALFQHAMEGAGQKDVRSRIGFHLDHRIQHGLLPLWEWLRGGRKGLPVLDTIDTRVSFDGETESELQPVVGQVPSMLAETRVRMGGEAETALELPAVNLAWIPLKDGSRPSWTLHWQGLRGGLVLGPQGITLAGQITAPGFSFENDRRKLVGTTLDATVDWVRNTSGWWVGRTGIDAHDLYEERRSSHGKGVVSHLGFQSLTASGDSHVRDGRFSVRLDVVADRLTLGTHAGAPFHLQMDVLGDDSASVPAGESEAPEVPEAASADSWRSILDHHPVLEVTSFSIGTPAGAVAGSGRLVLKPIQPAATPPGAQAAASTSPPGTRIAAASLESRFPAALVDHSLAGLPGGGSAPLVKEGLLVPQDGSYQTHLALGPKGITANGKPVDPVTLAGVQRLADAFMRPAPAAPAVPAAAPAPAAPAAPAQADAGSTVAAGKPGPGAKPTPAPPAAPGPKAPAAPPAAPATAP